MTNSTLIPMTIIAVILYALVVLCPACTTPTELQSAYDNGYKAAKLEEKPRADIELSLITYAELMSFLKKDQCDRCGSSVAGETADKACIDRADCLTASARNYDWDCYGVIMNFKESSHSIVAFPTKDRGLVYIEPWFDKPVKVEVGYNYVENFPEMRGTSIIEKIGVFK
jgi:hypothetical protein